MSSVKRSETSTTTAPESGDRAAMSKVAMMGSKLELSTAREMGSDSSATFS